MKAIETRYAGCRFRSRLEARWAVFLNTLEVAWEYEPEGVELGGGRRYLPDFRINRRDRSSLWVEVKGSDASLDVDLIAAAVKEGLAPLLVLGPVPEPSPVPMHALFRNIFGHVCLVQALIMPDMRLTQISREIEVGAPEFLTDLAAAATVSEKWTAPGRLPRKAVDAYVAARSARFEHGESG